MFCEVVAQLSKAQVAGHTHKPVPGRDKSERRYEWSEFSRDPWSKLLCSTFIGSRYKDVAGLHTARTGA